MSERYISAGTACGRMSRSDRAYLMHDGQMYGLPPVGYELWRRFRNGETTQEATMGIAANSEQEAEGLKAALDDLIRLRLLVPFSDATKYIPQRLGTGLGLNDAGTLFEIQAETKVQTGFLPYVIWCLADGHTSVREIRHKISENSIPCTDKEFVHAYLGLLLTDALGLV